MRVRNSFIVAIIVLAVFAAQAAGARVSVTLTVTEPSRVARDGEGVHSGVPFAEGELESVDELILTDEDGEPVPAQFEALSTWDDGSVRWALVVFSESIGEGQTSRYTLRSRKRGEEIPHPARVTVTDANDVFTVDTGAVAFDIPIYENTIIDNIRRKAPDGSWRTVSSDGLEAVIWRGGHKRFKSRVEQCTVESAGPERAVLRIEGHHLLWDHFNTMWDPAEIATFKFVARVFCHAGSDRIRLQYTFINDNLDNKIRPSERYHVYEMEELAAYKWVNGHWVERPAGIKFREQELLNNDYGQIAVKDIKLRLTLDGDYDSYSFGKAGGGESSGTIDGPVALEQVGPVHSYNYHTKETPFPYTPFEAQVIHGREPAVDSFPKADGTVVISGDENTLTLASKFFWQYHPKMYALDRSWLEFSVWNTLEDIPAPEIGLAKTHEVTLRFGGPSDMAGADGILAGLNCPLMAVASPEHYMATGVFGTYRSANHEMWGGFEQNLHASAENTSKTRDERDIYGVRNFGDMPGIRYVPIYYNQEYDILLGAMLQFARTGDRTFFNESDILAWHFADIDILHASNSPLNEGGQHMHFTDHAKGETHAGHCTVEGLWYYYMLTGEPRMKEVAVGIADFFAKIAAWKDFLDYRDDEERTIGWSLKALVPSWRATRNPRYKLAAQMIVEQAIAGQDPYTGNWDHPLYPNEDKHRPVCVGGKPWMVGIILQGMKHYHREFGDPRVKDLILNAADWMIWSQYRYMTCTDREPRVCSEQHWDGLTYAWELSGKRYYLDEVLKGFAERRASWDPEHARGYVVRGSDVEAAANVMRIIEEEGRDVWRDGEPVFDDDSAETVEEIRADPKYKADPVKRY